MIKVKGVIYMRNDFEVELDMTEEEFDRLRRHDQDEEIASAVDWRSWMEGADIHDLDVWEVDEVEEEK